MRMEVLTNFHLVPSTTHKQSKEKLHRPIHSSFLGRKYPASSLPLGIHRPIRIEQKTHLGAHNSANTSGNSGVRRFAAVRIGGEICCSTKPSYTKAREPVTGYKSTQCKSQCPTGKHTLLPDGRNCATMGRTNNGRWRRWPQQRQRLWPEINTRNVCTRSRVRVGFGNMSPADAARARYCTASEKFEGRPVAVTVVSVDWTNGRGRGFDRFTHESVKRTSFSACMCVCFFAWVS